VSITTDDTPDTMISSRAFRTLRPVALAATLLLGAVSAHANLLVNGSFEDINGASLQGWGGYTYSSGMAGWAVDSGTVDIAVTGTAWGPAADGANSLDINGWDSGAISQSFATIAGQAYSVSFAYSRNPAGAADPATATVSAGGMLMNVSAANDGSHGSTFNMVWKPASFNFIATGTLATVALASTSGSAGGVFFDSVAVTAVPEPGSWALMVAGLLAVGSLVSRCRTRG
jgi:choice-of-anchor C domain-containing protein